MYRALSYFTDLLDKGYAYKRGDIYPRKGYTPTAERLAELSSNKNKRGVAVIAEIGNEKPIEAARVEKVDNVPSDFMNPPTSGDNEAVEQPKKRGRKKKDVE